MAKAIGRGTPFISELVKVCATMCKACENECQKHHLEHCQKCADACSKCRKRAEIYLPKQVNIHIRINRNREIPFKGKLPVSPEMVINPRIIQQKMQP
ncbi:hypothetical protein V7139_19720 [Neobacillus drentensis]|uniref:hypothetical protein n=1 Tax=Neobacillus drentensis TaxID=220684 RepID=UPI0030001AEE